jgi:hydroxypyruvate isomerase
MERRSFITALFSSGLASTLASSPVAAAPQDAKGRLRQSIMRTTFDSNLSFEDMCRETARIGFVGMDMIDPKDWPTLRKYGLTPTLAPLGGITLEDGIIRKELQEKLAVGLRKQIDLCAQEGCPAVFVVGGQRKGMSYEEGAESAVGFFNLVRGHAEEKGVDVWIEVMNNKFQDPTLGRWDQICNHVDWAVDVVKRVNSPRVKILFDIYHVQIMDGDVVHHIQENLEWIGHFHTAGVPGRHELDDTQELNYHFIAKSIADLGFKGTIAHEYRPSPGKDPIKDLEQAFEILTV